MRPARSLSTPPAAASRYGMAMRSVCARKSSGIMRPLRRAPRSRRRTSGTDVATARITTAWSTSTICLGTSAFTASPPCDSVAKSSAASTMPTGWLRPTSATAMPRKPAPRGESFLVVVLVAEHVVEPAECRRWRPRRRARATSRRPTLTPAYSAARGWSPTARSSKPRRVRNRYQPRATAAAIASRIVGVGRRAVEGRRTGRRGAAARRSRSPACAACPGTCSFALVEIVEQREHDEVQHDRHDHLVRAEPRLEHAGHGADDAAAERGGEE